MADKRKNTFIMDFSVMPRQIKDAEVVQFMEEVLKMTHDHVVSLQPRKNLIYVETPTLDIAQNYVDEHDRKHKISIEEHEYVVRIYMEDGAVNVKIRDLPPQWDNELIVRRLMQFGKVVAIKDDVWEVGFVKGKKNGTRTVRMVITKPIPSYVQISSEIAFVSYVNQQHTCKSCSQPVHPNRKCSEMKENKKNLESRLQRAQSAIDLTDDTNLLGGQTSAQLWQRVPPPPLLMSPYANALATGSNPINLNQLNDAHRDAVKRPLDQNALEGQTDPEQPQTLLDYVKNMAKAPHQKLPADAM